MLTNPLRSLAALAIASTTVFSACMGGPVEEQLQQVLERGVTKPGVMLPGAIAYHNGPAHLPWSGAAGLGDVPGKVAMRPQDQFRGGSVLKTFLATATLQQVEKGALSLDQTLPTLLPEAVTSRIANADRISLRMLLNHTSGIPDWVTPEVVARVATEPAHVWSPDEAIAIASQLPPTFAPGTSWGYSNTNYTLVGTVLDRAGEKSWRTQVREGVIQRLGLSNTHLLESGDLAVAGEYAHGYQEVDGVVMDLTAVDPSMAGAAGGHTLVTTAEDLGHFLEALLAGELFASPATLDAMKTMVEAPDESELPHRYGLGLEEYTLPNGTTVIGHSGSSAGYSAMMFRVPARDATLVTAVNTDELFVNAVEVFMPAVDIVAAVDR